jgi:hypothetical protein
VRAYQTSKSLPVTGVLDEDTWPTLLREPSVAPDWAAKAARASRAKGARAASAAVVGAAPAGPNGPASAGLRARRDEIPPGPLR